MMYLEYIRDSVFYSIVDAIVFALALIVLLRLIDWLVPFAEWKTIKKSPLASTIIAATAIIMFTLLTVSGYFVPMPIEEISRAF